MFFRNLMFFRFPMSSTKALTTIDNVLSDAALKPVGLLETMSRGFVSPFGRDDAAISHRIGDALWITLGGEDKLLPASVINAALSKKIIDIENKEDRKLSARARKRLKEDLVHELLPRAFVRPMRLNASLDLKQGFIAVDTSSRKAAEALVSELRHALGSFPALPLNAEVSPRGLFTAWIAGEPLPHGFALGDECELKDPTDGGAVVRCQRQELQSEEIRKHLESGKQVTRLAMVFDDRVSFVLGDDLVVRKVKLLEGSVDQLENTERESLDAELDARFALFSSELARLFAALEKALKLSKPE